MLCSQVPNPYFSVMVVGNFRYDGEAKPSLGLIQALFFF